MTTRSKRLPRLMDAEAEARFRAAINARIEENLNDPSPDIDDEEVQASIDETIRRAEAQHAPKRIQPHISPRPRRSPRPSS